MIIGVLCKCVVSYLASADLGQVEESPLSTNQNRYPKIKKLFIRKDDVKLISRLTGPTDRNFIVFKKIILYYRKMTGLIMTNIFLLKYYFLSKYFKPGHDQPIFFMIRPLNDYSIWYIIKRKIVRNTSIERLFVT